MTGMTEVDPDRHLDTRQLVRVSTVLGDDDAGDEGEDGSLIERKQHIAREKKRMISAIQAARIAYQARMIRAITAQRGRHSQDGLALVGPQDSQA